MEGKSVRIAVHSRFAVAEQGLHDAFGPFRISHIGTAGDSPDIRGIVNPLLHPVSGMILSHIGLVTAVFIRIELRSHVAAASPVFIAHAEEINLPCFRMPVFRAQVRHGGDAFKCHVLNPFRHLLHGSAAQVAVDISLASQLPAQFHVLMRAEAVVLHNAAPVGIDHLLAAFFRTDAVFPVILIREASARPAQNRNPDLFQGFNNVAAHAVHIRYIGVLSHIDALIDAASEMFRKMTVDLLIDFALFNSSIDIIIRHFYLPYNAETLNHAETVMHISPLRRRRSCRRSGTSGKSGKSPESG